MSIKPNHSKRYPDQSHTTTGYSPDNKPIMLTAKDQQPLFMDYASTGELQHIVGSSVELSFTYSLHKQLQSICTKNTTLTLGYNTLGEVQTQTQEGIAVHHKRIPHSYNTTLAYLDQSIHTHIDTPKRRTTITRNKRQHIVLSYDIKTKTQSIKYPNGTQEHYSFNSAGELQALQSTHPHHTLHIDYHYQRDALGRITTLSDKGSTQTKETVYSYDTIGRLTQANTQTFTYDKAGNNLHHNATYNTSNNQLLEDNTFTYSYDKKGNLTRKVNKQSQELYIYKYNALNQLIHHYKATADDRYIYKTKYTYDGLNRRVVKSTYTKETDTTTSHRYLYHEQNIIAILKQNETEAPTLLASIVHHPSRADTPLSITNHETNRTYYYHRDHQGSIIALTNEEGKLVESIAYDGHYGKILNHYKEEENLTLNPYGYTGRETDHSDLYYYRARYYDPHTQRFLSSDPIEFEAGDFNFYRYVSNDPLNYIDPSGLRPIGGHGAGRKKTEYKVPASIDSNSEATDHYYHGNGECVALGEKTKKLLREHELIKKQTKALKNGTAKHLNAKLSVDMTFKMFHMGKTPVDFNTTCNPEMCQTTFSANGDGVWDIVSGDDKMGPDGEFWGGHPFPYKDYNWTITYPNKFKKGNK